MKTKINFLASLLSLLFIAQTSSAQYDDQKLGLPGDNFNLYAVMDIFQNSKTLEEFEGSINKEDTKVNNLDLNNDGNVDYIKVIDNVKGKNHSIVLQADVNKNESQDIAVFYVEQNGSKVDIQLVGDEDLYGKNYIVEPNYEGNANNATPNPGYKGANGNTVNNYNTTNNYNNNNGYNNNYGYSPIVSNWAIITYMYGFGYNPWRSPWYWGYYPNYYRPWSCYYWYDYNYYWNYGYSWNSGWYYRSHRPRFNNMYPYYNQRRRSSITCRQYQRAGNYNRTYQGASNTGRNNNERQKGLPLVQRNSVTQMPERRVSAADRSNLQNNNDRQHNTRQIPTQKNDMQQGGVRQMDTRTAPTQRENMQLNTRPVPTQRNNMQQDTRPTPSNNDRQINNQPPLPNQQNNIERQSAPTRREIKRENSTIQRQQSTQRMESNPRQQFSQPSRQQPAMNNSRSYSQPSRSTAAPSRSTSMPSSGAERSGRR